MALSGVHIVAGYAGSFRREKSQPILGKLLWSENPASGTPTSNAAPPIHDIFGQAVFRFRAAADAFVAIGPSPNPSTGPRIFVAAGSDYDLFADAGDRVAWIAA